MIKTYKYLENIWFKINQKIRFLLVGGFNTTTSFILYYLFLYITQGREQISLLLMNIININISIVTMRYYVFQSHGDFKQEYLKAFRGNFKQQLMGIKIVDEKGNDVTPKKLKSEQSKKLN